MPRLSKVGAAALAAFGWTGSAGISASALVVAGGGSGGRDLTNGTATAGGGAGEVISASSISLNSTLSYTITVGAGGASQTSSRTNGNAGSSSSIGSLIVANGGGYGASYFNLGGSGGSGGGGSGDAGTGSGGKAGGSSTTGTLGGGTHYGNVGGTGSTTAEGCGGGGGAGAVGSNGSGNNSGAGGAGIANSISGSSVTYGGGGGGGGFSGSAGAGGSGGGGAGGAAGANGTNGTANLGGGGGGGGCAVGSVGNSGSGGSGVVIISYTGPQKFGGGVVTTSGSNVIHTFNTSGTLSPLSILSASYLIVAGGGAGSSGGGGAGGMQTGSGVTIDTNSIYVVTVGSGGAGALPSASTGNSGSNSSFSAYATASVGGGGGGLGNGTAGASGGSGGGGGGNGSGSAGAGGAATSGQGNAGGAGFVASGRNPSGGGGGAGAVGGTATGASTSTGGNGGAGLASSISGTSTYYAGGGGGAGDVSGSGGTGGGGSATTVGVGTSGTVNTGGGGGGVFNNYTTGSGGSGIVIISYAGSTQQMAGGTVTISGGNVIHTFTSSGYLTPIKYVNNSLRFRSSASAYLSRTPSVAGNQQIFTWSGWVKRGKLGTAQGIFGPTQGSGYATTQKLSTVLFNSSDQLQWSEYYSADGQSDTWSYSLVTTQVFRDPSAWYHIVFTMDTTQATASNRMKMYVNGVQITSFATANYVTQNFNSWINSTSTVHYFGTYGLSGLGNFYDGYLAEVNFVNAQQLTPNSFGTFNSYGVWQPITYGGSYGTNGFYLPFTDNTNTTTLGYDSSPNGNNWTLNNISLGSTVITSFTATGTTTWTVPTGVKSVNYLVVGAGGGGGGGSGGAYGGGGGGGGEVLAGSLTVTPGASVTVTVGTGGSGQTSYATDNGTDGGSSVFSSITSRGGKRAGNPMLSAGASGNGNAAGTKVNFYTGAGGGGAGGVGGDGGNGYNTYGGSGGSGVSSSISGSSVAYGGGGGGYCYQSGSPGSGTDGGGSAGPTGNNNGYPGTANRGGGGGGANVTGGAGTADYTGGAGGSGVVIVSYTSPTTSSYDSMTDVPTLTSATASNYAVMNPLNRGASGTGPADGNLSWGAGGHATCLSTIGVSSGQWYAEFTLTTSSAGGFGITSNQAAENSYGNLAGKWWIYDNTGSFNIINQTSATYSGSPRFTTNQVWQVALDVTNGKCFIGTGNSWVDSAGGSTGNPSTGANPTFTFTAGTQMFYMLEVAGCVWAANFGQRPFTNTAPSGYVALNTYNM